MAEYIEREAFIAEQRHIYCDNCNRRKGMKNGKMKFVYDIGEAVCRACDIGDMLDSVDDYPAADVRPVPEGGIGEMSDGYHTFSGLYYQRMVLFAALVKAYKDKAWKSHRHEDGELCFGGGWFIVGIDTPDGSYTYHYEDKDWDRFDCQEMPAAKHWDGHTEEDVTRLLSLPDVRPVVRGKNIGKDYNEVDQFVCSECGVELQEWVRVERDEDYGEVTYHEQRLNFCPICGADVREAKT